MVIKKGSRLSVQPVSKTEYDIVARLGRKAKSVQRVAAASTPSGGNLRHKSRSRLK
jgi:hypothetical protein